MDSYGQTLILFDNSVSVSEVNREIARQTLSYLFGHSGGGRAYCLATYTHNLEQDEVYTTEYRTLESQVFAIEYIEKEKCLTDVITSVLKKWKEADFACRDILIITDGLDSDSTEYDREELFYMIENTDYPIYVVDLVQEDNSAVKKNLSAIATTSGGRLVMSEFAGSDASVEKQIGDELSSAMDEYAKREWYMYYEDEPRTQESEPESADIDNSDDNMEEAMEGGGDVAPTKDEYANTNPDAVHQDSDVSAAQVTDGSSDSTRKEDMETAAIETADVADEDRYSSLYEGDLIEGVIYEQEKQTTILDNPGLMVIIALSVLTLVIAGFLVACLVMKKRKEESLKKSEEYKEMVNREVSKRSVLFTKEDEGILFGQDSGLSEAAAAERHSDTRPLNSFFDAGDAATRLLFNEDEGFTVTMEDVNDPSRFFKAGVHDRLIIGRTASLCDMVLDYDDSVSGRHCEISIRDEHWYISDLNSSNGTMVNGQRIYKETELISGDMIKLGCLSLIVRFS